MATCRLCGTTRVVYRQARREHPAPKDHLRAQGWVFPLKGKAGPLCPTCAGGVDTTGRGGFYRNEGR
jgi:hypothetical protein